MDRPRLQRLVSWPGIVAAACVVTLTLGLQAWRLYDPHIQYDRFQLPAFDAHVYVAMAERPAFFTVAPWGYRLLAPWLAAVAPAASPVRGFYLLTWASLVGTGLLLYAWLLRLGNGARTSLLGVAFFGLSGPVAAALGYPFVADPLCLLLLVAFLLAFEAGAGLAVLGLLAVLGALTKEILLAALPLLFLAALRQTPTAEGGRLRWLGAAGRALVAATPALVATLALRLWWTPHLRGGDAPLSLAGLLDGVALVLASWRSWWLPALVTGLVPLAFLGSLRRAARPFLRDYGYLGATYAALPFLAGVYVGTDERPREFFSGDVPRLTLHLVPLLLPLGLLALDRLWPHRTSGPAPAPWSLPRLVRLAAALAAVLLACVPFVTLDRYRREDLARVRDGLLVHATVRESLRLAEQLERGRAIVLGPQTHWVPGRDIPPLMGKMRWFLREGWGRDPQYGSRDIALRDPEARLLVPCLRPRDTTLTLTLDAPVPEHVSVTLNGLVQVQRLVGREPVTFELRAPRSSFYRGDNVLIFARAGQSRPGPRLLRLEIRPEAAPAFGAATRP